MVMFWKKLIRNWLKVISWHNYKKRVLFSVL
jgi:hypothetical protein